MELGQHEFSERFRFSDWPNRLIPSVAAGVYGIWEEDDLIYCGMSGRGIDGARGKRTRYGLYTRLSSHASGRLSGDQFCVYVANRIVIPSLLPADLSLFESGALNLDLLTKRYIHEKLTYNYLIVESSEDAYRLELECQRGNVFGVKPRLNPRE